MKQLTSLGLLLVSLFATAQSTDTLRTTTVVDRYLRVDDERTAADSLQLLVRSAADYLTKDARYQLRQYAPGSVVTSNFGGANPAQSAVLWDGIDIGSSASGVLDLSLVPAALLKSNAILEGSAAGATGTNAISGALNLSLEASGKREFTTLLSTDNIGGLGIGVLNGGHFGKVNYRSYLFTQQSDNVYPYTLGNQRLQMEGMAYSQLNFMQRYQGNFRRSSWSSDVWYTSGEKFNRGSILNAPIPSLLEDRSLRAKYTWEKRKNKLTVFAGREWQSYTDTLNAIDLRDTNTYDQITLQYRRTGEFTATTLDANYYRAGGTSRDASLPSLTYRQFVQWTPSWSSRARLGLFRGQLYPAAQIIWHKNIQRIPIEWATGSFYRVPTMNELFWTPGGNPDLSPERSYGTKLTASFKGEHWSLTANSDQLLVNGLIQWVPQSGAVWSPVNFKQVFLSTQTATLHYKKYGFMSTTSLNQQYTRVVNVSGGSTADIGKALIYRPNLQAVQTFAYRNKQSVVQLRSHYLGARHTFRDNDPTGVLGAEFWADLTWIQEFIDGQITTSVTVHNLTNTNRTYFPYFPMPGRYFSIQLKLTSKK